MMPGDVDPAQFIAILYLPRHLFLLVMFVEWRRACRWSLIAGRLPGRTDNEIKNYWNTTLGKKVHGRPLRAPKPRLTAEGSQKTPSEEEKSPSEASPAQPPAPPPKTAEGTTTQAGMITRCSENVLRGNGQMEGPIHDGQTLNSATAKSSACHGETSLLDNTSNDFVTGLHLIEGMSTVCPPDSSLFLVNNGLGEEAHNGGSGAEESSRRDSYDRLLDRATLGDWLEADVSVPDHQYSPSDFLLLGSFLDSEEW